MIRQTNSLLPLRGTGFYLHCPPQMPIPAELQWPAAFLTNVIYCGMIARPDYRRGVPISMAWLKRVLGRKAQGTMARLLDLGVIERTTGYVVGESPYAYRLLPPYDQCQRVECADRRLIGRIVEQSRGHLPVIKWLERRARTLCIDEAAAMAEIAYLQPRRQGGSIQDVRDTAARCVHLIAARDIEMRLDDVQGRIFAPHVTLHRTLRRYLRSPDGQPIVSMDIRNCQPLLLTLAFAQYYHPDSKRRHRLLNHAIASKRNPYLWPQLRTVGTSLHIPNSPHRKSLAEDNLQQSVHHIEHSCSPLCLCCPRVPSLVRLNDSSLVVEHATSAEVYHALLPPSCSAWAQLASMGSLYEAFGDDREAVKEQFILVLFGRRPLARYEVGRQILRDFPDVATVINAMKQKNSLIGKDPRPYRYVACLLQLYESTMMIYRICGRIMRERPDTPVWTIHDCLLTSDPHKEYVRQVIREEFAGVGIFPSIKDQFL